MKYLAALTLFLCAPGAFAAETMRTPFEDKFRLTSGFLYSDTDTLVRVDQDNGAIGTLVSGEGDLGLRDRTAMADIEVELRLRPRHRIRLNYFELDRRQQTVLNRQIEFGEETYLLNDLTESRLGVSNFSTTYSYLFLRRDKFEMGASLGLQLYSFEGELSVPARLIDENESETGPVPLAGLEASAIISSRWHLGGAMLVVNAGLILLAAFVLHWPDPGMMTRSWNAALILGAIGVIINRRLSTAVFDPSPARVQASIRTLLMSLVMLDATIVFFANDNRLYAFGVVLLLLPAQLLARYLAVT